MFSCKNIRYHFTRLLSLSKYNGNRALTLAKGIFSIIINLETWRLENLLSTTTFYINMQGTEEDWNHRHQHHKYKNSVKYHRLTVHPTVLLHSHAILPLPEKNV